MPKNPLAAGVETSTSMTPSRISKSFTTAAPPSRSRLRRPPCSATSAFPCNSQRGESGGSASASSGSAWTTAAAKRGSTSKRMRTAIPISEAFRGSDRKGDFGGAMFQSVTAIVRPDATDKERTMRPRIYLLLSQVLTSGTQRALGSAMIRDTSAQDTVLTPARRRLSKRGAIGLAAGVALIALSAWLLAGWRSSSHVANAARLRIVAVAQGTLVRDASVNGRVVAAVSPTLFAPAAATVTLQVHAGDTVKKGQVLAKLESPDLEGAFKREQSTTEELQAEISRQEILARKQKLIALRDADQAEIERAAAQRAFERIEKVGGLGIVAKNDFEKAQDALRSAEIRGRHAAEAAKLEGSDVELQLKTRRAQLQRQRFALEEAKRRVDELTLRAPMDGVVGSIAVADRGVVPANAPIMTLVDLSRLEVELEIPESYMSDLGVGMKAEISVGDIKAA